MTDDINSKPFSVKRVEECKPKTHNWADFKRCVKENKTTDKLK